ncbi:hypothetical protein ROZALSC1DRAFT_31242, partial [Rozella allomycis CSF55]
HFLLVFINGKARIYSNVQHALFFLLPFCVSAILASLPLGSDVYTYNDEVNTCWFEYDPDHAPEKLVISVVWIWSTLFGPICLSVLYGLFAVLFTSYRIYLRNDAGSNSESNHASAMKSKNFSESFYAIKSTNSLGGAASSVDVLRSGKKIDASDLKTKSGNELDELGKQKQVEQKKPKKCILWPIIPICSYFVLIVDLMTNSEMYLASSASIGMGIPGILHLIAFLADNRVRKFIRMRGKWKT